MGHGDAALGEKVLNITQAQSEAVMRLDGIADDGPRKPMPLEARETVEVQYPSWLSGLRSIINLTIPQPRGYRQTKATRSQSLQRSPRMGGGWSSSTTPFASTGFDPRLRTGGDV